ncbi:MAG: hypothetical protein ABJM82_18850 [Shimia thalassica]|uniref:hypothetical protein n=1 Tax=Shimia thalassica TaxID=1715693 RepID=UPI0032980402
MAQKTLTPSALSAVVGIIEPDATAVGDHSTGWISMSDFQAVSAIVMAGALGTAATLDAKFEQATDDAGSDLKDVEGAAITQLTKAGGDDNVQSIIEIWGEDLDIANDFTHVRLTLTVAGANSDLAAVVMGTHPRQGPASDHDLDSVAEIVNL